MQKRTYEKPKDLKGTLRLLLNYIKKHLALLGVVLVLAAAGAILTVIGPDRISKIADLMVAGLVTGIDMGAVADIAIPLVIIYGLSALFTFLQHFLMAGITQDVSKKMRSDISAKINKIPLKYFGNHAFGDVLSRMTNDVDTLGQGLNNSVAPLVAAFAQIIGSLVMMFSKNWILTVAALTSTILGFVLMSLIMKKSQKYFFGRQKALGSLNGYIEEMYAGHAVVRTSSAEGKVRNRFDGLNRSVREANWKSQFLSGIMQPLMNFIGNIGFVVVCVVGAILTMNDIISIGTIVAFMIYIRLFTNPLGQIAQGMTNIQQSAAASERVFEFLREDELPDESRKTTVLTKTRGSITFDHVRFSYPDEPEKIVIKDFSAHVEPGQKIAIVGPTGAGKTTLVNLIMRFYDLNSGRILIDGIPIDQVKREAVHDLFGMVLQDTWLFEGTVRENLIYNLDEVSDADLEEALKACGIWRFVKSLPKGLDTVLDENTAVSAGQKQLLTIARAMIQNHPMLILDEATSSVDTRTEIFTQQAMDKLMEHRTSFVIAHRLSTIKNADMILVIRHGDIVEQGTHAELLAKGGFYAELYNSQFELALS